MKPVELIYQVDVDAYNHEDNYYGEIVDATSKNLIYSHYNALKSFAFKEDMTHDLIRKCAEYGYEVVNVIDETNVPSFWEENI
jgi:hypothetical protein